MSMKVKKQIPLNQTFHGMRAMSDHILSDEYKMYGQDDLAWRQYMKAETGLMLTAGDRDTLAEDCTTVDSWSAFLDKHGVAYYIDDYTPTFMSVKGQRQWVRTLWIMAHTCTTDVVFGHVVRDLTFYIKPIMLSKGMQAQWSALQSGKITREQFVRGKVEHATPVKILRQKILDSTTPIHMVRTVMKHLQLVYVTLCEDARIDAAGYKDSLPENGTWHTRYNHSKVEVHPELVRISQKLVSGGAKTGVQIG
jgi:hypothetical protein